MYDVGGVTPEVMECFHAAFQSVHIKIERESLKLDLKC